MTFGKYCQASTMDTSLKRDDVTVVLPTKNEEDAIGSVIDEVLTCGYRKIFVVDGNSTDQTAKIAKERGIRVIPQAGKGKRDAVLTALPLIDTRYCVFMDADMTYDAHDIDILLWNAEGYDQLVGIRQPQPGAMNGMHKVGNRILTRVFNVLFGVRLSDVLSGMYLLDTEFARSLQFDLGEFTVEQEILAQSTAIGRVKEVQINYRKRHGKSKVHTWTQGTKDIITMFSLARRYSPVILFSLLSASAIIPAAIILGWVLLEALVDRTFHMGYSTLALLLLIIGAQGLTVSSLSLSMKLTLRQFERRLQRTRLHNDIRNDGF